MPSGRRVAGVVRPPPSKSQTHRAYAMALLARAPVVVERPLAAEDTQLFLAALAKLGLGIERGREEIAISPPVAPVSSVEIFCGNAGTLFRFFVALAATLPSRVRLDGTARLRERPVGPLVAALRELGVRIDEAGAPGCAPLVVHGGELGGGTIRLDASSSSQYLSAILLAGQRARSPIEVAVPQLASAPYVELTVAMIERFGGRVDRPAAQSFVTWPSALHGARVRIEADLSAAAYPAAAAAVTGGEVEIAGVARDSKQGDRRFLELLAEMGAAVEWREGSVSVTGGRLRAVDADLADIPDQVPTLAAIAPFARGATHIRNVAHLRIKESDRLAAMAGELRRAGAEVEELADGLVIPGVWAEGEPPSSPVEIDPHGDHRIAMAMAVVALRRPRLAIADPACVAKSYPDFWRDLARWLGEPA